MGTKVSFIGKIIEIIQIPTAERIESAIVVCGAGGRWQGCVQKGEFAPGDLCFVFLQDALLPELPEFEHMRKHKFRVKMCRFLGTPSEILITKPFGNVGDVNIGDEITWLNILKYEKPIPINMQGENKGSFPSFIPKTDEINFQAIPELVECIIGKAFYATLKYDGTSATFYHNNGEIGVCSRNLEKKLTSDDVYNLIDKKYSITDQLKTLGNFAIQGEIVGPGIQKNHSGLKSTEIRVFDIYDIDKREYLPQSKLFEICEDFKLPPAEIIIHAVWTISNFEQFRQFAEQSYSNGKPAEGVVVRVQNFDDDKRISFKIINLNYKG